MMSSECSASVRASMGCPRMRPRSRDCARACTAYTPQEAKHSRTSLRSDAQMVHGAASALHASEPLPPSQKAKKLSSCSAATLAQSCQSEASGLGIAVQVTPRSMEGTGGLGGVFGDGASGGRGGCSGGG
eukprot:4827378-Pleurochrysis_carterae.AAC.3